MLETIRSLILARCPELEAEDITEEADLYLDLELSDRDLLRCVAALEDMTGLTADREALEDLHTVGQLAALFE